MAVNKSFVVKNGLEVNTNLILADANTQKVGIGSTGPRTELDVRGGIAATDFYLSGIGTFANELNVGTDGSVLTALGIGGSVGVGTAIPEYLLDIRSPVSTGQTALYIQGDVQITGDLSVDDITFDQADINTLNVTGFATIAQLGVIGLTTTANLRVSGVSTFNDYIVINDNVDISGTLNVGGATTLSGYVDINNSVDISTDLNVSGIATIATVDINAGDIEVSNVDTANLNVTGIATIATISVVGAELTNLNVTGVTTLGTVQVSSGIVTATSGVVTYYGDGSQLDGVIGGIGINTEGGLVGFGITYLHLFGAGVSTTFYDQSVGIATIFLEGGGGGGSVSISSVAPSFPENGDLWYSIDYGRTFVYYDEVTLGVGSTAVWVDAAPFNLGVVDLDDLTVNSLTVNDLLSLSGIITANSGIVTYFGDLQIEGSSKINIGTGVTIYGNTGIVSATSFYGDGANLSNTGSTLSSASGTQRIVVTGQTSGTMTASATDADLTFDASTNTLSVPQALIGSNVTINSSGLNVSGIVTSTTAIVGSAVTINSSGINATSGIITASTFNDGAGNLRSIPQNAKTASYNLASTDNGKHISITTGGVSVLTSAGFNIGDTVAIYNNSSSNQTITQGAGVTLRRAGTSDTGNRTLAQYGICTLICVSSNTYVISGTGIS